MSHQSPTTNDQPLTHQPPTTNHHSFHPSSNLQLGYPPTGRGFDRPRPGTGRSLELIALADGSAPEYREMNRSISVFPEATYQELPQNIGRAAIRNRLGNLAQYPFLLFMDADSEVVRGDYLKVYVQALAEDTVLVGGTCYAPEPPGDADLFLRWHYGVHREQRPVEFRRRSPWNSFLTHHFVISRSVFKQVRFDERLRDYGHEDTLFGLALQKAGLSIIHLDNPLKHAGLEPASVFLEKTESSIRNLVFLHSKGYHLPTRLLDAFRLLKRLGFASWAAGGFERYQAALRKRLEGPAPRLWQLDLYKLGYLCRVMNNPE
ncbi:MAG: glycosyltransferase [Haliscomenobacter sp.]|nr:glycosyltransferase [Haliscomenobacter sp.]